MKGIIMFVKVLALLFVLPVSAAELKGKKFEDTLTIDGKKLELNALGIRRVSKFGIPVKVYVGGFYVTKKTTDAKEMLKMDRPVFFRQVWLLGADKDPIVEGWEKAFNDNCEIECDKAKAGLKEFKDLITDVRDDTEVTVKLTKEGVEVDNKGKPAKKGVIKNPAFATAFLYIFFGKNPPDEKFQKELLGQVKE
jgi:hypothetical protein